MIKETRETQPARQGSYKEKHAMFNKTAQYIVEVMSIVNHYLLFYELTTIFVIVIFCATRYFVFGG